jgi:hypothetical protein
VPVANGGVECQVHAGHRHAPGGGVGR